LPEAEDPAAQATLEGLAALVRQTSGLVTGVVDGVAQAAGAGAAGHDALKARQWRGHLIDLHAEIVRLRALMHDTVRRNLADYLRAWTDTARLHSRCDLPDPAARAAALERASAERRGRGLPLPTQADHDARLDASWERLRKAMSEAGGTVAAILQDMQAERGAAMLDTGWTALMRSVHTRIGVYDALAALPSPVTRAEITRLAEVTEAYEALIANLDAVAVRLAALAREAG
jgi:hypothetical protein